MRRLIVFLIAAFVIPMGVAVSWYMMWVYYQVSMWLLLRLASWVVYFST